MPKYQDASESDVYILSGAEDLVPVLTEKGGKWQAEVLPPRTINGETFRIRRYRPRVEGLFARIERWTNEKTGGIHWRSISRDNVTTLYGKSAESRVYDPADPTRVFSWLICESYDDRGNAIIYKYARENSLGVDPSQAHERNRTDLSRSANCYLKRIKYGNLPSRLVQSNLAAMNWLFEVVFDYGEGQYLALPPDLEGREYIQAKYLKDVEDGIPNWAIRQDPFSSYKAGFEVRTYRLCRRALMFHHFPDELGTPNYLVRSTEFTYDESSVASFITAVAQSGYVRTEGDTYLRKSLPPLEFEYSKPPSSEEMAALEIEEIDAESLENLPEGLDGGRYQWVDLDGEGVSGILTEQGGAWFYKPNLGGGRFGPVEVMRSEPSLADLNSGRQKLMDMAGDGQLDIVELGKPTPGFFERTQNRRWEDFTPFDSLPEVAWEDPNLRLVDLTGDGHADVLVGDDHAAIWYPSLAEDGFAQAEPMPQVKEDERGPRLIFADGAQSIYLADMSGDGLVDVARIRNGEVCYWPNLGYGRFGPKVSMDNAPWFDAPDQFEQQRIRLTDLDGSGTTDIVYLGRGGVHLYFNQAGNSWATPRRLPQFPLVDNLSSVQAVDLLGSGTACLVWSSPLPGESSRPLRYIDLMGGVKPHLLVSMENNLGAETHVHYAPSTKFYLADKAAGKPWITRLPFVVHVVERTEVYDRISRNRFVTRYAYHHGYYDGIEREFRGFGMVEQWDTEEFAALKGGELPTGDNIDEASHVPPVLTRTWFHPGTYLGRNHISDFYAGMLDGDDIGEYYREPGLSDAQARELLLEDTVLPDDLTVEEEREACRALKGAMLRQEIYALDASDKEPHPYTVTEQNFAIRRLQPKANNRHAVFFTHAREAINFHYERNPADPRVAHAMTLEVDDFGNVLKKVAIGYGRRKTIKIINEQGEIKEIPNAALGDLDLADQKKQTDNLVTYAENRVTNSIDNIAVYPDDYRTPLPCETRTYELTGYAPTGPAGRFQVSDIVQPDPADPSGQKQLHVFDGEDKYEDEPTGSERRRLIEQVRTLYRRDDLTALLPLGESKPLALPGESYKLAFTPGLLSKVYQRDGLPLLPNVANVLGGQGPDQGGYVNLDADDRWWIPSGRVFHSPSSSDTPAQELAHAHQHFFIPHRIQDPFAQAGAVSYDDYDLLQLETRDAMGNRVTAGERDANGEITAQGNDYRVLQPSIMTDPNRNRFAVAFDALGMVVGTAVMGKKPEEKLGDSLDGFISDLPEAVILGHVAQPLINTQAILNHATSRLVYDLSAFQRTKDQLEPQPAVVYALVRETHESDLEPGQETKVQHGFSYSDGFGREIQKKVQAEPGPLEKGGPDISPRWVGSGWTIFNNKGKPVRQYEPFFSATHHFEFGVQVGVSPIIFYDPVGRVAATLHPNQTYEKVVFNPWQQTTWDVNDTVLGDPRTDADIQGYTAAYFATLPVNPPAPPWQSWYTQRHGGALGTQEQASAIKAAAHADTPTMACFDALGRHFLTVAHNKVDCPDHDLDGKEDMFQTRVDLDIEGNQREVRDAVVQAGDAQGRIVMHYGYDMLGNRIHQASMEAGKRWMLNDAASKPIRAWDSKGHEFRTAYDALRRPIESHKLEGTTSKLLVGRSIYGEAQPDPEGNNLRGKVVQLFDQAGVVTTDDYDFKGNLLSSRRQLAQEYKTTLDWSTAVPLEKATYSSRTRFDALNRPIQMVAPHSDQPGTNISVTQPVYNEANLLEKMHAWLNQNAEPPDLLDVFTANLKAVADIDYNAKGQRTLIEYGNGVRTTYEYHPLTFRLAHLLTERDAVAFTDDCPQQPPTGWPGCQVQNLDYTYDPIGNITHIRDEAQQTIYFKNKRVEASAEYTYDAIYRLIEATGREHLGQVGGAPIPHSHDDAPRVGMDWSANDGNAMGRYVERYVYDAVGNILKMQHRGSDPAHPGWTRTYIYNETSLIEDGNNGTLLKTSNRLTSTAVGATQEAYSNNGDGYDPHGNMLKMPHLPVMGWDYRDQLCNTDLGGGGAAYYVYDAAGQRVSKVWEKSSTHIEERIYLGGFEVFRRQEGPEMLERETLHIMDDQQRIALVETRTIDTAGKDLAPPQLIRYQFGNHLGSSSLELDGQAQIISYEEYTPYGSSSYQAVRNKTETPKRLRHTGKERDEETGLYYHGARYYAPWLGRWTSTDPLGLRGGDNSYQYADGRPTTHIDPTGLTSIDVKPQKHVRVLQDRIIFEDEPKSPSSNEALKGKRGQKGAKGQTGKIHVPGFGSGAPHNKQGPAYRAPGASGKYISESEHIWPQSHAELVHNAPELRSSYEKTPTIKIPERVADLKTKWDIEVLNKAKAELQTNGKLSQETLRELSPEAGLDRLMRARDELNMQRAFTREQAADVLERQVRTVQDAIARLPARSPNQSVEAAKPESRPTGNRSGQRGVASGGLIASLAFIGLIVLDDLRKTKTKEEAQQVALGHAKALAGWIVALKALAVVAGAVVAESVAAGLMTCGDDPRSCQGEAASTQETAPQILDVPSSPPPTSVNNEPQGFW